MCVGQEHPQSHVRRVDLCTDWASVVKHHRPVESAWSALQDHADRLMYAANRTARCEHNLPQVVSPKFFFYLGNSFVVPNFFTLLAMQKPS